MVNKGFGKILTAMVTPFKADGSVNFEEAEKLAIHLVENGSDGLVVCGTTGESPTLTWEEEVELFKVIKQTLKVYPNKTIVAGTGSNCTSEAIAATQQAVELGLDGSLQVVPYYNKPPQDGLYEHFKAIAQACPSMAIMLYNVPGRTSCRLEQPTVSKLAEIPNITCIKEASGDLELTAQIRNNTPDDFAIYSGDDFLTLPMMTVGGEGVVSVASHIVGNPMQQMINAFLAGDYQTAIKIQLQLTPLFKSLFCITNPIPVKTALALQGWQTSTLRSPLISGSEELQQHLKTMMNNLNLL
jgi:4-hydroxy-tetrahydrodipicolinate synthase